MKKLLLTFSFLAMIAFGFFQENVKVAINFQIDYLSRYPQLEQLSGSSRAEALEKLAPVSNIDYYYNHHRFEMLSYLSKSELSTLKWLHTLGFTLMYLGMNLLAAFFWTGKRLFGPINLFYAGLFTMALCIYLVGVLVGWIPPFYAVSRKIIGVLQSPLPVLITWLTITLRINLAKQ